MKLPCVLICLCLQDCGCLRISVQVDVCSFIDRLLCVVNHCVLRLNFLIRYDIMEVQKKCLFREKTLHLQEGHMYKFERYRQLGLAD